MATWKSTSTTANLPDSAAQLLIPLTGGGGEVLSVSADGRFTDDLSAVQPLTGTASSHTYMVTASGKVTGTLTASARRATLTYDDVTQSTTTVVKDGVTMGTAHGANSTSTYTCQAGTSLVVTGTDGNVTTYSPGS